MIHAAESVLPHLRHNVLDLHHQCIHVVLVVLHHPVAEDSLKPYSLGYSE